MMTVMGHQPAVKRPVLKYPVLVVLRRVSTPTMIRIKEPVFNLALILFICSCSLW